MSDNIIHVNQDLIHTELKDLVRNSVEEALNAMLDAEADKLVNADRYSCCRKTSEDASDKGCQEGGRKHC